VFFFFTWKTRTNLFSVFVSSYSGNEIDASQPYKSAHLTTLKICTRFHTETYVTLSPRPTRRTTQDQGVLAKHSEKEIHDPICPRNWASIQRCFLLPNSWRESIVNLALRVDRWLSQLRSQYSGFLLRNKEGKIRWTTKHQENLNELLFQWPGCTQSRSTHQKCQKRFPVATSWQFWLALLLPL